MKRTDTEAGLKQPQSKFIDLTVDDPEEEEAGDISDKNEALKDLREIIRAGTIENFNADVLMPRLECKEIIENIILIGNPGQWGITLVNMLESCQDILSEDDVHVMKHLWYSTINSEYREQWQKFIIDKEVLLTKDDFEDGNVELYIREVITIILKKPELHSSEIITLLLQKYSAQCLFKIDEVNSFISSIASKWQPKIRSLGRFTGTDEQWSLVQNEKKEFIAQLENSLEFFCEHILQPGVVNDAPNTPQEIQALRQIIDTQREQYEQKKGSSIQTLSKRIVKVTLPDELREEKALIDSCDETFSLLVEYKVSPIHLKRYVQVVLANRDEQFVTECQMNKNVVLADTFYEVLEVCDKPVDHPDIDDFLIRYARRLIDCSDMESLKEPVISGYDIKKHDVFDKFIEVIIAEVGRSLSDNAERDFLFWILDFAIRVWEDEFDDTEIFIELLKKLCVGAEFKISQVILDFIELQ